MLKSKDNSKLLSFYFGSIKDEDRMDLEQELLVDSETLLDYLDLKRSIEKAALVPSQPSRQLWDSLRGYSQAKKKIFLSLSLGAAAAVLIAGSVFLFKSVGTEPVKSSHGAIRESEQKPGEILFDSMSELSGGSNVL